MVMEKTKSQSLAQVFAIVSSILSVPGVGGALYGAFMLCQLEVYYGLALIIPPVLGILLLRGYFSIWKGKKTSKEASRIWIFSALFNGVGSAILVTIYANTGDDLPWLMLWIVGLIAATLGSIAGARSAFGSKNYPF